MATMGDPRQNEAARHLAAALRALGIEPVGPNLEGTPERVAELWSELFSGLDPKTAPDLSAFPNPDASGGVVAAVGLPFHAMCAHHLLPFFGHAHVAYLPDARIVGFGSIASLVDFCARKPTLQEQIAAEVADAITRACAPRGVAVLLEGRHLCMEMRGAHKRGRMETAVWRGVFADDASRRAEFLDRVRAGRRRRSAPTAGDPR